MKNLLGEKITPATGGRIYVVLNDIWHGARTEEDPITFSGIFFLEDCGEVQP
jgi:hypothetical protein